jgi:hypothetical protein
MIESIQTGDIFGPGGIVFISIAYFNFLNSLGIEMESCRKKT